MLFGEKSNQTIKKLNNSFWENNRLRYVTAMILYLVTASANLLISIVLQEVVDVAAGMGGKAELESIAMKVVLVIVGLLPVGYLYSAIRASFVAKAMKQYKNCITEKIMKKGIGVFRNESTALYTSGLTNDCQVIEENFLLARFEMVMMIFLFIGSLCIMIRYSALLTFVAIVFSLIPIIVSIRTGKRIAPLEEKTSQKNESYVGIIQETLTGFSVIKSFKAELKILKLVAEENRNLENVKQKRNYTRNTVLLLGTVAGMITQLGVFIVGAILCLYGREITPGMLIVFVNLLNFIVQPIAKLPALIANFMASKKLISKMEQALSIEASVDINDSKDNMVCEHNRGIKFKNVSYSYEDGKSILKDFNFHFEKDKSYAIVGTSGCGKSTLLQLLLAGMNSYTGEILYDDKELSKIHSESLYDIVSTIQQNVFVFNASIKDNITMFGNFPKEEIDKVIELSGLSELIAQKGEDYMCGENGCSLSGGEKQRISIARALLRKSKVLLVDEATASLDAKTSNMVLKAILELENMTRIIVTHDLDEGSLKKFDKILTIKNGVVLEAGSFSELMDKKGYFYSLYTVAQ